jgi:nucleotide-binding universal stress UspA family protein
MESLNHSIVVPYDFTAMSKNAVAHSVILAARLNVGVTLLHIAKKKEEIANREQDLAAEVEKISVEMNIKLAFLVRKGSIFKTINRVARELDATIIVMGTHGLKGMQKLTGSRALKVILGSRIPFLVVQEAPKPGLSYRNIVFPVDFKTENKEKLKWVQFMSQYFKSNTILFADSSKEGVIEQRTRANLLFCKSFLEENRINYELVLAEHNRPFSEETLKHAVDNDADLIIIMTSRDIAFHAYILGAQEQYMIANSAKIPVMVINPRTDLVKYGYNNF